ncbi:hypothetical protein AB0892_08485 [Streptomyces sp. NPDC005409]|uniref:hypothetical protein n=1 Tax=Streptomyces sp. NPDC005409 TaxID=3155342 RepID=UPI003454A683
MRVLVVGWQPQPQQLMADVAGIRGPGSATGERYALAGFHRLIEDRAQRARDLSDFGAGWMPRGGVAGVDGHVGAGRRRTDEGDRIGGEDADHRARRAREQGEL